MPTLQPDDVERAIARLATHDTFPGSTGPLEVRTLFPLTSWKPHPHAPAGTTSLVMGEDACGNRFLCAPDGSVTFWDHETDQEIPLTRTVIEFLEALTKRPPTVLKPGQVESAWINPAFLKAQKQKGNA